MNCWIFYALFPPGDRWRDAHDSVPTGTVPVVEPPFMVVPAATLSICSYILELDRGVIVHFTVMVAYVYALFPSCIVNTQHVMWKFCLHTYIYIIFIHSFIRFSSASLNLSFHNYATFCRTRKQEHKT